MNLEQRIESFVKLGQFFNQFTTKGIIKKDNSEFNSLFLMHLKCKLIEQLNLMAGLQRTMF